jgi:hypothetical protein
MSAAAPISEAQLNANRRNAERSTGPQTESGKQRVRLNGLRHGLTGQTVVMPGEDRAVYQQFCAGTIAALQPSGSAELALAQSIADDTWRLNRARAIEENIFALDLATTAPASDDDYETHQALTQARTFLDRAREIQLLTLYAGRIARTLAKNTAELNMLQAARAKAREDAFEEAILLARLAQSKGETWNPCHYFAENGFAFSTAEITRAIDRRSRLREAIALFRNGAKAA